MNNQKWHFYSQRRTTGITPTLVLTTAIRKNFKGNMNTTFQHYKKEVIYGPHSSHQFHKKKKISTCIASIIRPPVPLLCVPSFPLALPFVSPFPLTTPFLHLHHLSLRYFLYHITVRPAISTITIIHLQQYYRITGTPYYIEGTSDFIVSVE